MYTKKIFSLLIGLTALFAVITQFQLMFESSTVNTTETTIRFFSYFTILTNSLVAIYFLWLFFWMKGANTQLLHHTPTTLIPITAYILVVGLIYQVILRPLWNPEGLNKVVDELLHSVVPLATGLFWIIYGRTHRITYASVGKWLLYPLVYLIYIIIRGYFSDFYPYPFIDVSVLGYAKVSLNAMLVAVVFTGILLLLIFINNLSLKKHNPQRK